MYKLFYQARWKQEWTSTHKARYFSIRKDREQWQSVLASDTIVGLGEAGAVLDKKIGGLVQKLASEGPGVDVGVIPVADLLSTSAAGAAHVGNTGVDAAAFVEDDVGPVEGKSCGIVPGDIMPGEDDQSKNMAP